MDEQIDVLKPLTEAQWAEKLDHSIAQTDRGELINADVVTDRIRKDVEKKLRRG